MLDNGTNHTIGVWASTERPAADGAFKQVSRLGFPLVNEVLIPLGEKDHWNAVDPVDDAQFFQYILDPEPAKLIPVLYPGVKVPPAPRNDLVSIFLTGIEGLNMPKGVVPSSQLRLNTDIAPAANPSRLGILGGDTAGFPNGRRPADDVVDIELRALAGGTPLTPAFNVAPNNTLGDGVDVNDVPFRQSFPYLADPQDYEDTE
jgi:hypothetical protein